MRNDTRVIVDHLASLIGHDPEPCAIVLEAGHITLPIQEANAAWAAANLSLVDDIAGTLIRSYGRRVRIINTWLVNDLGVPAIGDPGPLVSAFFGHLRYLTPATVRLVQERTIRNRAAKNLKKIRTVQADGRVFTDTGDQAACSLPIANINGHGAMVPRCTTIMGSFVERVVEFAHHRLCAAPNPHVILLSFAEHEHEYEQTRAGIGFYHWQTPTARLTTMVVNWSSRELNTLSISNDIKPEWQNYDYSKNDCRNPRPRINQPRGCASITGIRARGNPLDM